MMLIAWLGLARYIHPTRLYSLAVLRDGFLRVANDPNTSIIGNLMDELKILHPEKYSNTVNQLKKVSFSRVDTKSPPKKSHENKVNLNKYMNIKNLA